MTACKILVVEDDQVISESIVNALNSWGYEAKGICDFRQVLTEFAAFSPQLVLLDISLPFYNGFYWCGEIRKLSKVPIIFISSADERMNIVMAVNMGGDDFIAKPFDMTVLTAKVQAILRRSYDFSAGSAAGFIEHGGLILNTADMTASCHGQTVTLTRNEYRILQVLMENAGRVISRDSLMQRLWETDSYVDENTLTVNINRLRKKLETVGMADLIVTRKGTGYMVE